MDEKIDKYINRYIEKDLLQGIDSYNYGGWLSKSTVQHSQSGRGNPNQTGRLDPQGLSCGEPLSSGKA